MIPPVNGGGDGLIETTSNSSVGGFCATAELADRARSMLRSLHCEVIVRHIPRERLTGRNGNMDERFDSQDRAD